MAVSKLLLLLFASACKATLRWLSGAVAMCLDNRVVCVQVKDAFGLPLQSSVNTWWTVDLEAAYQGPNLNQVC
jgi:hypothetical protein